MAETRLVLVADATELARRAAAEILERARSALAARGVFHLALAGGSTPRAAYSELARRAGEASFAGWHIWFGDERCVGPEHRDSNFRMAAEAWLARRAGDARVHRLRGEAPDAELEAERYARELVVCLGEPPRLDLVLLGLGADGHTASLFPGGEVLAAKSWVAVGRAPVAPALRLSLTLPTLNAARGALFLVSGAEKAAALRAVFASGDSTRPPAALVHPDGPLLWLLDRAAAEAAGVAVEGLEPPTRGL